MAERQPTRSEVAKPTVRFSNLPQHGTAPLETLTCSQYWLGIVFLSLQRQIRIRKRSRVAVHLPRRD
jgi:hypothetical protein